MFKRRKRTAYAAEEMIRIKIHSDVPDVYRSYHREFMLTPEQAHYLLLDLRDALDGPQA